MQSQSFFSFPFSSHTVHCSFLSARYHEKRSLIHAALCDSIDTPTVVKHIRELLTISNTYMNPQSPGATPNAKLLENIAQYITYLLRVFGVINSSDQSVGFPVESGQTGQAGNTVC